MTGDDRVTASNFVHYIRSRIYVAIQYDSDAAVDVLLGQLCPAACTVSIHRHAYARFAILVVVVLGVYDYVTFHSGTAVTLGRLDGVEFESLCFRVESYGRNAPLQTQVFRQFRQNFGHRQISVDFCCILIAGIAYYRTTIGVHLQNGQ